MKHIFPFAEIDKGKRIVLYGASECGYDFYRQLVSTEYAQVVLWVDRQFAWYRYMNLPVDSPDKILTVDYDLVVVTAEEDCIYHSIKKDIISLGISEKKIFWKQNCLIIGNVAATYDEERIQREAKSSVRISPKCFLTSDRLDIIIRILYAQDIISGRDNPFHRELYWKFMMMENGGKEPTENMLSAFFSEYTIKRGFKAFESSFIEMINSMSCDGFNREKFIPIDISKKLINGAHRVGAAIALGIDVWTYVYPVSVKPLIFDVEWFLCNGFSKIETEYIKREYEMLVV